MGGTNKEKRKSAEPMCKVKKVRLMRTFSIIGDIGVYLICRELEIPYLTSILMVPFTCLSGVVAFMYYKMSKDDKKKVYALSLLHLSTIGAHPYFWFPGLVFMNVMNISPKM